jgi:hypothetical protein
MAEQSYIVTDRGGSRSYPTLVTVDGPRDGDLYIKAHEAAARINPDLADCGKEISAFPITENKRIQWLNLETKYKVAIDGLPATLEEMRQVQAERRAFLEKL